MKKIVVAVFLALVMVWGVGVQKADATYWTPTSSGIINTNYVGSSSLFAIFDDSDASLTGSYLELSSTFDTLYFMSKGSDWELWRDTTPGDDTPDTYTGFTLTDSPVFQVGWYDGATWKIDTSYFGSDGVYQIKWEYDPQVAILYQIDAQPVPIPGAVWLLGSGLIGLVGIRRKKKA